MKYTFCTVYKSNTDHHHVLFPLEGDRALSNTDKALITIIPMSSVHPVSQSSACYVSSFFHCNQD